MNSLSMSLLFVVTAIAEIAGCYLPKPWPRDQAECWVPIPAAADARKAKDRQFQRDPDALDVGRLRAKAPGAA